MKKKKFIDDFEVDENGYVKTESYDKTKVQAYEKEIEQSRISHNEKNVFNQQNLKDHISPEKVEPIYTIEARNVVSKLMKTIISILFLSLFFFLTFASFSNSQDAFKYLPYIGACIFIGFFTLFTIYPFVRQIIKKKQRTIKVESKIIDIKKTYGSKGKTIYAPVVQYEYEGQTYIFESTNYTGTGSYRTNDTVEVYINNQDYTDAYIPITLKGFIFLIAFDIFFIFAIIMMILRIF